SLGSLESSLTDATRRGEITYVTRQTVAGSSPVGSGWFSFVYRDAASHGDLVLPRIKAAPNAHRPAPTISRKRSPSHMEKSVRASCIMLQKPYRGSFISENPQKA